MAESAANPCESYYRENSTWHDLYNSKVPHNYTANFCIKGLAIETGLRIDSTSDFRPAGPVGGPFLPETKVYYLNNISDHTIQYRVTCEPEYEWLELSGNVQGSLAPSETAEISVSINDFTATLDEDAYPGYLHFTNISNHLGDTNRNIVLSIGAPVVQYEWFLDDDPGWSTQGQWEFGQPTGQGGSHGSTDPTGGYSGSKVYGYNLHGDYSNNMYERHLSTTAIDCRGLFNVHLSFMRWLGVEQPEFDHASVKASADGIHWITVWENTTGITDMSWEMMEIDVGHVIDNQPEACIRWTMGETDRGWTYCGWNIDDIALSAIVASEIPPTFTPSPTDGCGKTAS